MISNAPGTADTPRAHLVNPYALECLRDIGLEDDADRMGVQGDGVHIFRWCRSLLGEEYGRVQMWGGAPSSARDLEDSTPCRFLDLPQSYLEPILLRYATTNGVTALFNTELTAFERSEKGVVATVKDLVFGHTNQIRSRFIFGADGGRSTVGRHGNFKFHAEPSGGVACNIVFEADLQDRMLNREAEINWCLKPDAKTRLGGGVAMRQIRPWKQWMAVAVTPNTDQDPFKEFHTKSPELIDGLKEVIGDDDVEINVLRLDSWHIRETCVETMSSERDTFLLGDAAHRHPPAFGLGSNTCIQDAYNLAWKIAYVAKGLAGPALLDSYNSERQPVASQLVRESNIEMHRHLATWQALGMFEPTPEAGKKQIDLLVEPGRDGDARRAELFQSLEGKRVEGESLGIDMNQWYDSSAVYLDDEQPRPPFQGNPLTNILISTYPGTRLPHAWIAKGALTQISTQDLAGHASFCLITGVGGDAWREAATQVSKATSIPIKVYGIGWGLDYRDKLRDWQKRREVEEDGCVLVRPDRFVAWRSTKMIADPKEKLSLVLDHVLSRTTVELPNGR